ncbi:MYND-type domain-containing protein [Mycena sanguinolenta]|uniref:MYND-type domain-containing protein n=1 Tax=Mycena sanguinolenta TaxID=230812 RepID=A0A8H6Z0F3_9AGAR|nr:MYND-type domain-containing protein [Mycena sanguinolenta]
MTALALEIRVVISGFNDRRCEVLLRREVPPEVQSNFALLDGWAQKATMAIGYDMKHTQRWECEACGQPARETWFDPRPSLRPSEPVVVLHIHHLCETGGGPCHTAVENRARELAIEVGDMVPPPSLHLPTPSGSVMPLASGCAKCQRDETGAPGSHISRCSRCKLTRYCSVKCQTEDWLRHGKICKTVKEVKWVNWEDNTQEQDLPLRMPGAYYP